MKTITEMKDTALAALKGKWETAVITTLVVVIVCVAVAGSAYCLGIPIDFDEKEGSNAGSMFSNLTELLMLPLSWGFVVYFLRLLRGSSDLSTGSAFRGYKQFGRIFLTMLLRQVYTFLWALLLIIPGIVKYYSYAMTEYVLNDNPDLKYNGAINRSMKLMSGHKWKLFVMDLSFLGWAILSLLTCGIGYLWLLPYYNTTRAAFYHELLKEEELASQPAAPEAPAASEAPAAPAAEEPAAE